MSTFRLSSRLLVALSTLAFMVGCGGGSSNSSQAPAIGVSISPTAVTLIGGATQTFTATVTNDSANAGVTWTATVGTITSGGVYTAPSPVTTATATVTATSKTDATKSASATVTLTPIAVSISPTAPVAMVAGATQTFTATVTGDNANAGVTWTASVGSITAAGVYTAPTPVATASATVTATSKTDSTKSATATVPLTPIAVGVAPPTATLIGGATQTFAATVTGDTTLNAGVTWTASTGSITAGGVYTAPAVVSVTSATVTATSKTDPTKTGTAAVTLTPIAVAIAPASPVSMIGGATQAFTATVTSDSSNSGVTWSVTGGGSFTLGATASGTPTTYTAASPVAGTSAVVTATSVKDPTRSASVTVPLLPIAISFTTTTTGVSLDSGQTLPLAAVVTNDFLASGVDFTVSGAGTVSPTTVAGNNPATTLTATGTVASTVTVTATSIKDPTRSTSTAAIAVSPALAINTAAGALAAGTTGTAYSSAIASTGGSGAKTYAVASGTLPAGLSINSASGAITGTPTASGTSTFTVKVTDSATTPVSLIGGSYTITVTAAPLVWTSPTAGTLTYTVGTAITPIALTTTGGTGTVSYSVNSGTLPQGLSIVGNQVTGTPTAPTVVGGNAITFLAIDSATPTPATATSASVTLIANPVTLAITSGALPAGVVGSPYSYQLTSTGGTGAVTWSLASGSLTGTGLSLSGSGLITGTPTSTVSGLSLTFQAKDSAVNQQQTKTAALVLNITNVLTVTTGTSSLPYAYVSQAYPTTTLTAAGGSGTGYTWTVTSGLTGANSLATLNLSVSAAGVITGTPATTGTANFTVQVKDSLNNTATQSYSITAYGVLALPSPNPGSLGSATTTASYTGSITATGGISPYSWTVNGTGAGTVSLGNGTLSASPNGATLNITGTPGSAGTVSFTAKVQDSAGNSSGPFTYTIAVSSTYTVSGLMYTTAGCGGALSGITVSINTSPVQTTTTGIGGTFSFSNVPNGTYTITPSIVGPSSVFYPATQSVTVNGGNNTSTTFNGTLGYTVSGTVSYSGTQTGPVYLALNSTTCSGGGSLGTSLTTKSGAYTIRGVPPGTYTLQASLDNQGYGALNAANPTGSTGSVTVTTANLTGVGVTLSDPATVTLTSAPTLKGVAPVNTGVVAQFKAITNGLGVEAATSYTLQWSTTQAFTAVAGSKTFPANGTHTNVWFVNGLTNGSVYYFRAYGTSGGTATSAYSSVYGPVTIGSPTGGNTVSGSVTFAGTATGPMYVGAYDLNNSAFYGQYIASPASAQAFTVQVPTDTAYELIAVIDQNNDGIIDTGDITNITNGNVVNQIAISSNLSNQTVALPTAAGVAIVYTQNFKSTTSSGTTQLYDLSFQVSGQLKRPIAVALTGSSNASGANLIAPMDIAICGGLGSPCGQGFQDYFSIGSVSPSVGDTYTFSVTYSDGTTGTLTAAVTAVLNSFASNLAPTGVGGSTTPTFSWTDPTSAGSYLYSFTLNDASGNTVWQIPASSSNSNGFASSITSIPWSTTTDPTGAANPPTVTSLSTAITYSWQLQVIDTYGNAAVDQVNYQP